MKKSLIIFGTALLLCICSAFDWPVQSNEKLREEMLAYANEFAQYCDSSTINLQSAKKEQAAHIVYRMISEENASNDPYSWIGAVHNTVAELKELYPPLPENFAIRSRIMQLLDYPLHVNNHQQDAPAAMLEEYYSSTMSYLEGAKNQVLSRLKRKARNQGVEVIKLYNMGFIIRTEGHTVGIDITDRFGLPQEYLVWKEEDYQQLTEGLDALFLTHPHGDHFSTKLMLSIIEAGKTLILPSCPDGFIPGPNVLIVDSTLTSPYKISEGLEFMAFRGNQGENIPCNIYLMEIDGQRILHNGDNYDRTQEALVADYPAAKIIIGSSWNKLQSLLTSAMKAPGAAQAKQWFIPAHENELCHTVDHRESYHELFNNEDRLGNKEFKYPEIMVLDNGEFYYFR